MAHPLKTLPQDLHVDWIVFSHKDLKMLLISHLSPCAAKLPVHVANDTRNYGKAKSQTDLFEIPEKGVKLTCTHADARVFDDKVNNGLLISDLGHKNFHLDMTLMRMCKGICCNVGECLTDSSFISVYKLRQSGMLDDGVMDSLSLRIVQEGAGCLPNTAGKIKHLVFDQVLPFLSFGQIHLLLLSPNFDEFTVNETKHGRSLYLLLVPLSTFTNNSLMPRLETLPWLEIACSALANKLFVGIASPFDFFNLALSKEDNEVAAADTQWDVE
ncbi:hypothetical protein HG531_005222 [Fusarium graminearum]|nr:hypothetical protein HG531_005222 [Fusarium graminearum]